LAHADRSSVPAPSIVAADADRANTTSARASRCCATAKDQAWIVKINLRFFSEHFRNVAANSTYIGNLMTKEDKILVFLKLRGGSGPIDTIREAVDIREAVVFRRSNPLAKKLIADGLLTHPRRNHYVLTARGDARARELIGR
jgi:hypothetical protein